MDKPAEVPVLKVENLEVVYDTRRGPVAAVRDVSLEIPSGEALGLVGESGCGKSTLAFAIMCHVAKNARIAGGRILFCGKPMQDLGVRELRQIRGNQLAMVYQDPVAALNPALRIGLQLVEVLTEHKTVSRDDARDQVIGMLERVRMPDPPAIMERYRHQLSGGQLQRVVIAMAFLTNPRLLVLDEPTTSLDVTVEAGILDLIDELRRDFGVTILFISHNLGVISRVADRVAVMYAGEMVEQGAVRDIFRAPQHPYTAALLDCVPKISASRQPQTVKPIKGTVPDLNEAPRGCLFQPRCDRARERCELELPPLASTAQGTLARCFFPGSPGPEERTAQLSEAGDGPFASSEGPPVLEIEALKAYYRARESGLGGLDGRRKKGFVKAVDEVSLTAPKNAIVGIVGESGCGKTTLAKCVAGLVSPSSGRMEVLGIDIARVVERRPNALLKELQMVFQNPDSTLNPKRSVGEAIARPLQLFGTVPLSEVRDEVLRLLEAVRLSEAYYDRLPRQLSGGEKQRVALARAFAGRPELVLCDEPLSSLDVSVQAAVINLLMEFQRKFETTMLFISHDLSVVYQLCDSVAVMYLGQFCETGPTEALFAPPYHPYTEALLSAVPIPDPTVERATIRLSGAVPSALKPPSGCRFHTRCPHKLGPICEREPPPWRETTSGHRICCHITVEDLQAMKPVLGSA